MVALESEANVLFRGQKVMERDFMGRKILLDNKSQNRMDFVAIISGLGLVNAQIATSYLIDMGCSDIYNVGTCGYLPEGDPIFKVGDVVVPMVFFDGDFSSPDSATMDPCNVNADKLDSYDKKDALYSFSSFVEKDRINGALVDMEAYSVVAHCRAYNIPVTVVKVISDTGCYDEYLEQETEVMEKALFKLREVCNL